jgi:hypothetical protein
MRIGWTWLHRKWIVALEHCGLDGLLVVAGTAMVGAIAGLVALPRFDNPSPGDPLDAAVPLEIFRLVFLAGVGATVFYAALYVTARRLRAEHAALADAALRLGEIDLHDPIEVRGLAAEVGSALELARQRCAERFRRLEDRLLLAHRKVASLESPADDAAEDGAPLVEVRVAGRKSEGKLVEVSQRALVVRMPSASAADLASGMDALLVVKSPADGARVDIPVTTARRIDRDDRVLYTFNVNAPERLVSLPPSLCALFDNRRDFRVAPDPRTPLPAELLVAGSAAPVSGRVIDVSGSGIGLWVRCDPSLLASWGTRVTVRVHLPGRRVPFAARARLRNVHASAGGCRVGLSFHAESAEELQSIQREVGDYVLSRHRELRATALQLAS